MDESEADFLVFEGTRLVMRGDRASATGAAWRTLDGGGTEPVLMFDGATGRVVDLPPRVEGAPVAEAAAPAKRGRPKLGVVPREVTLLPRHWEWLSAQPGGASVALRRLVEAARREGGDEDRARSARDAAYRFMATMAGDLPGFEAASRALFAAAPARLAEQIEAWPRDVRDEILRLLQPRPLI
ncbi:DUF2239 family protein [Brevundimonas sp. R86498]|uniref:DUF2239 family protein n=1 Tax=Brevundimonas sp. R86498 TaxID=3093845 RepID=UPI0037C7C903